MTDLIDDFASLFAGNTDATGMDEGGCYRHAVDVQDYNAHLYGHHPMGVYPIERFVNDEGSEAYQGCVWGCVDIDVKGPNHASGMEPGSAWACALNLRAALATFGITGWIECTRSGGYHVWVFAVDFVGPALMRRALLLASEIANVPPTEVNPKQEWLAEGQFGNYVRLPYPGALTEEWNDTDLRQYVIDSDNQCMSLVNFVADANESLTSAYTIKHLADHYRPPVDTNVEFKGEVQGAMIPLRKLNGLGYTIAQNPPLEGQDRSARLFKLAHCCKDSGLTPDEAVTVVRYADQKHGQKYVDRADVTVRYRATVRNAYA